MGVTTIRVSVEVRDRLAKLSDELSKNNVGKFTMNETIDFLLRGVGF